MSLSDDNKRKLAYAITNFNQSTPSPITLNENTKRVLQELSRESEKKSSTDVLGSEAYKGFVLEQKLNFFDQKVENLQLNAIKRVVRDEFLPKLRKDSSDR